MSKAEKSSNGSTTDTGKGNAKEAAIEVRRDRLDAEHATSLEAGSADEEEEEEGEEESYDSDNDDEEEIDDDDGDEDDEEEDDDEEDESDEDDGPGLRYLIEDHEGETDDDEEYEAEGSAGRSKGEVDLWSDVLSSINDCTYPDAAAAKAPTSKHSLEKQDGNDDDDDDADGASSKNGSSKKAKVES
ncbi:hypothetical protein CBS101457_005754 [Exobasidium rhododendri]|nr:hypothetical protein CBS101457_005754 [Exobasidium rhododendri]